MNIFAFDPSPWKSALWLDDVRKNKMILETAQLLSTACNVLNPDHGLSVYKTAYVNHPCAVWARDSYENFLWLVDYMCCIEQQRTNPHKSYALIPSFYSFLRKNKKAFPSYSMEGFVNCARNLERGVDFSSHPDVHKAYKLYICERWKEKTIKLSWNNGEKPLWIEQKQKP